MLDRIQLEDEHETHRFKDRPSQTRVPPPIERCVCLLVAAGRPIDIGPSLAAKILP